MAAAAPPATPRSKLNWKDSHLQLFDSDLEKAILKAAASEDKDWDKRIVEGPGLHLWRIEQLVVKPWNRPGTFCKGDSYLVLHTDDNGQHDIHIWVGNESTHDEYGAAAYKMIELDKRLGGTAVQHREVQGRESIQFLSYFKHSVTYLEGGVASSNVQNNNESSSSEPILYQIKGTVEKNTLRLIQVPLRRDSLNAGDVFVLHAPAVSSVWLWRGTDSNPDEKAKGLEVAQSFCGGSSSSSTTVPITLDQGVNDDDKQAAAFWKYLPGKIAILGPIKRSIHVQEADAKDDKGKGFVPVLYEIRAGSADGSKPPHFRKVAKAREVPVGPTRDMQPRLPRSKLKSASVFLLDTGFHVYVWWGLQCSSGGGGIHKGNAVGLAQQYIQDYKRPTLPVTVLKERQEVPNFARHFDDGAGSGCACSIL